MNSNKYVIEKAAHSQAVGNDRHSFIYPQSYRHAIRLQYSSHCLEPLKLKIKCIITSYMFSCYGVALKITA